MSESKVDTFMETKLVEKYVEGEGEREVRERGETGKMEGEED